MLGFDSVASTMGHKNLLASIHFLSLPFLIYTMVYNKSFWKYLAVISLIMILVVFRLIQSRAIILALIVFVASLAFNYRQSILQLKNIKWIIILILALSSSVFFIPNPNNSTDSFAQKIQRTLNFKESPRYNLFQSTFRLIKDNPLLGVGPGNWKIQIPKYKLYTNQKLEGQYTRGVSFAQRPHNDFLWITSEGGVLAGLVYIIIFLILIRDSYVLSRHKSNKQSLFFALLCSTLLGYGLISLVDFPFERISHNMFFAIISAIIIAHSINKKHKEDKTHYTITGAFIVLMLFTTYVGYIRYTGSIAIKKVENYKNQKNWNGMINEFHKGYHALFFDLNYTSTPLHWFSGIAYFNLNNLDMAFLNFKKAYSVNPNHIHVINNLATCYELKKNSQKAIELYKEAIEIIPTFKESRVNLAAIYFNQKKFTKSLDVILRSIVPPYKVRKVYNDNYDMYLYKIFSHYTDSVGDKCNSKQKQKLTSMLDLFNTDPDLASYRMKEIYGIRQLNSLSYLEAISVNLKDN